MEENNKKPVDQDFEAEPIDQEDELINSDYSDELLDWIQSEEIESFTCTLYRINGKRYSQIFKYRDQVPDSHEIGTQYGSGSYMLIGKFSKGKAKPRIKSYRVHLDKNYDFLMEESKRIKNQSLPQTTQPAQYQHDNGAAVFQMFKEVIGLLIPLLTHQQNSFNPAIMTDIYSNVNKLMYRSALEQTKMITDFTKKIADGDADDNDGGNDMQSAESIQSSNALDKIIEIIKQFLPLFLNSTGIQKTVLNQQVKSNPWFKQIVSDPKLLGDLIQALKGEIGEEKTNKLVQELGLKRKKMQEKRD